MRGAKWIDRALLESPYCIGLCQTEKQYRNEIKRLKLNIDDTWIPEDKDANVCELSRGNQKCYIVSIRAQKDTKPTDIIGLLIHEAVHIWQKICDDIGEDNPSPEFMAYSIQRIAQNLIEVYNIGKRR